VLTSGQGSERATSAIVRPVAASDVAAALAILEESPEASKWSGDALAQSIAQGMAWAAELHGQVAGMLLGRLVADEFEILNLAVRKACRRQGIAARLVLTALGAAQSAGACRCFLEVRASNGAALALYEHLGFHVCGRRPEYYRGPVEDAVVMVLNQREQTS
jgi:[ribosomal protein S18]-alanine N-acetyltransferase